MFQIFFMVVIIVSFIIPQFCSTFIIVNNLANEPADLEVENSLVDFIEIFLKNHRNWIHIIDALDRNDQDILFNMSHVLTRLTKLEIAVKIGKTRKSRPSFNTTENNKSSAIFVLFASIEDIREIFKLSPNETFDHYGNFCIVALKKLTDKEVEEIFKIFWKNFILNSSLIMKSNDKIEIFTYFPFESDKSCGNTVPRKINQYQNGAWNSTTIFPHKLENMNNCTIKIGCSVSVVEPYLIFANKSDTNSTLLGIEREIFDEVARLVNFHPSYKYLGSYPGILLPNGTSSGIMKALMDREIDVCLGFISLQYVRTMHLSATEPFTIEPMVILIPPGEEYGDFEKFGRPFDMIVWIFVVGIFAGIFIFVAIFHAISKIRNQRLFLEIRHPLLDFLAVIFGVTQHRLPFQNVSRFVLMLFILYCLVIRTVYQSGLYQIIKNNDRKPEMASMEEIIDKGFKFNVYETMAQRSQNLKFYNYSSIFPNNQFYLKAEESLDARNKKVMFFHKTQALYFNKFRSEEKRFHICKEEYVSNPITIYLSKNHYLVKEISFKLEALKANGFIKYVEEKYFDAENRKVVRDSKGPKQLGITQLRGAFYLLGICLSVSIIVLIIELFVVKFFNT